MNFGNPPTRLNPPTATPGAGNGIFDVSPGIRYHLWLPGEVAEWLNAPVSKTGLPARVAGVRISPSPFPPRDTLEPDDLRQHFHVGFEAVDGFDAGGGVGSASTGKSVSTLAADQGV